MHRGQVASQMELPRFLVWGTMENLAFLFIAGYIGDAIMIYLTYRDFKRAQVAPGSREVVGDVARFRVMIQRPSTNLICESLVAHEAMTRPRGLFRARGPRGRTARGQPILDSPTST